MEGGMLPDINEELMESIFADMTGRWTITRNDRTEWTSVLSISKAWRRKLLIRKARRILEEQLRRERLWMVQAGFDLTPTWIRKRLAWRDPVSGLMRDAWVKRRLGKKTYSYSILSWQKISAMHFYASFYCLLGDESYTVLPVSERRVWSFDDWTTSAEQEAWEWFEDARPRYSDIQFIQLTAEGVPTRVFAPARFRRDNNFEATVEGIPFNAFYDELRDDSASMLSDATLGWCWWRGRYDKNMIHKWSFRHYNIRLF